MAGVRLGGAVSAESVLAAAVRRLPPRDAPVLHRRGQHVGESEARAARRCPAALYELGVTITVAVTVAPQLVESAQRVRRARKLRGDTGRGRRAIRGIAMPVLHDALDRSFLLAAAMDSRGYGRAGRPRRARAPHDRRAAARAGCSACASALYGLLDTIDAAAARHADARARHRARGRRARRSAAAASSARGTGPTRGRSPEWATAVSGVRRGASR